MFDMAYLAVVLSAVDAVISPMSTLLIEALIIDKPTMAVAFGDDKHAYNPAVSAQMTHFQELRMSGIVEWCAEADRFEESCRRLIARSGERNDPELRRKTLDEIVLRDDRSYSRRLDAFARTTLERLARQRRGKRADRRRVSQSHIYHAHLIVKEYCSLPEPRPIPGHWMHGWLPSYHNVHPLIFATHKKLSGSSESEAERDIAREKETVALWTGREDQAQYLRGQGYARVKAIGLPFAYLPAFEGPRIPGSLLVMPPHAQLTRGPEDPLAEAYAESIASKRNEFSEIWLCLNVEDYRAGQWIESFRKRDIPMLVGAEPGDPMTLHRLKCLLSSFEYVTTNGFGSHIAYAARMWLRWNRHSRMYCSICTPNRPCGRISPSSLSTPRRPSVMKAGVSSRLVPISDQARRSWRPCSAGTTQRPPPRRRSRRSRQLSEIPDLGILGPMRRSGTAWNIWN
jgi:hypothetical protein